MQIPADMVINSIMMVIVAHKFQQSSETIIYHIGSSMRNCMRRIDFHRYIFQYFNEKPWINEDGNAIKIKNLTFFHNMASFNRYMTTHHLLFLKVCNKI